MNISFETEQSELTPEQKRQFSEEKLILDVTEAIWEVMEEKGYTKKDLADALACKPPHVTQLLNGSRNMTLRTLADIAYALEVPVSVRIGSTWTARSASISWTSTDMLDTYSNVIAGGQAFTSSFVVSGGGNTYCAPKFAIEPANAPRWTEPQSIKPRRAIAA